MRAVTICILLLMQSSLLAWPDKEENELRDPFFGEALFYASQDEFFDAISRIDTELRLHYGVDEPVLDTLHIHVNEAEFSVGDFELSYRMHRKAGRAIQAVIEGNVAPEIRNEAIYRLAKIYFQKEQNFNALHAIDRIEGNVPEDIEDDIAFLRAQIYMVNGRFEEAEALFESLKGKNDHEGYADYNLGLVRLAQGNLSAALLALESAGQLDSRDRAVLAIRDKANLTLGSRLMDEEEYGKAAPYLERVRIEGPFSNRALLGLGWANANLEDYKAALVPWSILSQRHVTDPAVQDALLNVPYVYGKLGLYGKAALGYGHALSIITNELDRLDASIKSIKDGKFLEALVREEFKQDRNWVIRLREMPQTPETFYLIDLLASHDFQSSLQNYFDLEQLRKKLELWADYYSSYEEMIEIRRRYYEPLLSGIDEQFRKLDSLMNLRLEQRDRIHNRLQAMLVSPRPELLATSDERLSLMELLSIEESRVNIGPDIQARIDRLKGLIRWNWTVEYDERLTETFEHLVELDKDIAKLKEIYESFVRSRQAATQSYQGYDTQITQLRQKTQRSLETVETLMLRQGRMLEVMAIDVLQQISQKLEAAQVQARFAMAESYDRATMSKLDLSKEKAIPESPVETGTTDQQLQSVATEVQGER